MDEKITRVPNEKSEIKEVTSIPEYIENFFKLNKDKISELYQENKKPYIIIKCNKNINNIDLLYLNYDELYHLINKNDDLMIKIYEKYNCIIFELNENKNNMFLLNI